MGLHILSFPDRLIAVAKASENFTMDASRLCSHPSVRNEILSSAARLDKYDEMLYFHTYEVMKAGHPISSIVSSNLINSVDSGFQIEHDEVEDNHGRR